MDVCRSIVCAIATVGIFCLHRTFSQSTCDAYSFRCNATLPCLSRSYFCDGINNCGDDEDEKNCGTCPDFKPIKCNGTVSKCITATDLCDGINNCGNEEDEDQCSMCPSDIQYKCKNTRSKCISSSYVCDAVEHCTGGDDERNCTRCSGSAYLCISTRTCVYGGSVCDGYRNCGNGEDENFCDTCLVDRPYKCQSSSKCIALADRCDGFKHCEGGQDERDCESCNGSGFWCNSTKTCISDLYICDGTSHCDDKEDEKNCDRCPASRSLKCNTTRSQCIFSFYKCNGSFDCPDGEDEKNCPIRRTTNPTITNTAPYLQSLTTADSEKRASVTFQKLGTGAYVGIIVGIIIGILLIATNICLLYQYIKLRRRNKAQDTEHKSAANPDGISNHALKISDETDVGAGTQPSYYNVLSTKNKKASQAVPDLGKAESNSAAENDYMALSGSSKGESHYYDSLKKS